MPDGGKLIIGARLDTARDNRPTGLEPGRYVCLSVTDAGTGMDEDTLSRAIEPFFSTKGVGKGTGLGLSMVHGLAAQLGGNLSIESEVGRGTKIDLWLPVSLERIEGSDDSDLQIVTAKSRGRVMLVDDEFLIRMSTADMLADLGFDVVEAGTAEEALKQFAEGEPLDVIITDHLMPGMSGAELVARVRAVEPDLPILIVSGYAELEGVAANIPRLTKPFRQSELEAKLREIINSPTHSR